MITAKKLHVTITYKVGLGNVEIPEEAYKQLSKASEASDTIEGSDDHYSDAVEWILANVKQKDCFMWEVDIDEIS